MSYINKVFLGGLIVSEPKRVGKNKEQLIFRLMTIRRYKDPVVGEYREYKTYHTVMAHYKMLGSGEKYLKKGVRVLVDGEQVCIEKRQPDNSFSSFTFVRPTTWITVFDRNPAIKGTEEEKIHIPAKGTPMDGYDPYNKKDADRDEENPDGFDDELLFRSTDEDP